MGDNKLKIWTPDSFTAVVAINGIVHDPNKNPDSYVRDGLKSIQSNIEIFTGAPEHRSFGKLIFRVARCRNTNFNSVHSFYQFKVEFLALNVLDMKSQEFKAGTLLPEPFATVFVWDTHLVTFILSNFICTIPEPPILSNGALQSPMEELVGAFHKAANTVISLQVLMTAGSERRLAFDKRFSKAIKIESAKDPLDRYFKGTDSSLSTTGDVLPTVQHPQKHRYHDRKEFLVFNYNQNDPVFDLAANPLTSDNHDCKDCYYLTTFYSYGVAAPNSPLCKTCQQACFNCGKFGHKAVYCKEPKVDRRKCYACHEQGHVINDCPKYCISCENIKHPWRDCEKFKCNRCGKQGHFGSDCTAKPACRICGLNHKAEKCDIVFTRADRGNPEAMNNALLREGRISLEEYDARVSALRGSEKDIWRQEMKRRIIAKEELYREDDEFYWGEVAKNPSAKSPAYEEEDNAHISGDDEKAPTSGNDQKVPLPDTEVKAYTTDDEKNTPIAPITGNEDQASFSDDEWESYVSDDEGESHIFINTGAEDEAPTSDNEETEKAHISGDKINAVITTDKGETSVSGVEEKKNEQATLSGDEEEAFYSAEEEMDPVSSDNIEESNSKNPVSDAWEIGVGIW